MVHGYGLEQRNRFELKPSTQQKEQLKNQIRRQNVEEE
jgi:hypothetical protein